MTQPDTTTPVSLVKAEKVSLVKVKPEPEPDPRPTMDDIISLRAALKLEAQGSYASVTGTMLATAQRLGLTTKKTVVGAWQDVDLFVRINGGEAGVPPKGKTVKILPLPKVTTVYGIWHGGANYGLSDRREQFASVSAAKDALKSRKEQGHNWPQEFVYGPDETDLALTPNVDETSYIDLYASAEAGADDLIGRLSFGKRGAVQHHKE